MMLIQKYYIHVISEMFKNECKLKGERLSEKTLIQEEINKVEFVYMYMYQLWHSTRKSKDLLNQVSGEKLEVGLGFLLHDQQI